MEVKISAQNAPLDSGEKGEEERGILSGEYDQLNKQEEREKYGRRSKWSNATHRAKIRILNSFILIIGIVIFVTLFHIAGPKLYRWLDPEDLAILYQILSFLGGGFVGHLSKPLIDGVFKKD